MKVGILTFHKSINYGSVLQCWALQKTLCDLGYEVEVIDYEPKMYDFLYAPFVKHEFKNNIRKIPLYPQIKRQIIEFRLFRENQLCLSPEKYYSNSDFSGLNKYDAIICGSDQIWNVRAYDCDEIYFLPFELKCRKIAYAVSVNSMTFKEPRANLTLKKNILDFDYISSREKEGSDKIQKFIGDSKTVGTVLDPTLLHGLKEYNEICSPQFVDSKYIFLYNIWNGKDTLEYAKRLSKKVNLPIYTGFMMRSVLSVVRIASQGVHVEMHYTSPSDFLTLIRDATYVVTDSFHGTAFSLIFEKQFVSINGSGSNGYSNDSRIINILNELGLIDRYIKIEEFDSFDIEKEISYTDVKMKRNYMAQQSINILNKSIEGILNS